MISLPRNDIEKQKILVRIAQKFKLGRNYPEQEVNDIIHSFDVDDHVLFRRELVNFNYLGKDTAKGIYWLKKNKLSEEDMTRIKANQESMENAGVY
ncbi:DUF2087 domain-containing protein [Candidatus Woesearchaeota archaeon]|nr:DUF2087 domain-containing protein [Candidatus Woesearchaeota archaeon]